MQKGDQRTRLTRMLLRKSLTGLLQQKPIQSITIKELCAAAGINRGTFYAHYTDIYDLLSQIEEEMLADFQEAMRPLLDDADSLTPTKITTGIFNCIKENADLCIVTLGPYGDKKFAARLLAIGQEHFLQSYTKCFEGATRTQLEYYYTFVSSGCIGILEKWLHDGMTTSAAQVAEMAESIMVNGVFFLHQDKV